MAFFQNNRVRLYFQECGRGVPFIFQHGLGGDVTQPLGLFKPPAGIRLIAFDARGHGQSDTISAEQVGLHASAEDVLALMNFLDVPHSIIGGISMGAAIALRFALRHPTKTLGLVLSRPAWLTGPNPFNQHMFGIIADLIETVGPEDGLRRFEQLPEFKELKRELPDTCESLSNQFKSPRARQMVANLKRIPNDPPLDSLEQLRSIHCPALVLANKKDPIHPYEYGVTLGEMIPGAQFCELTSKSVDMDRHRRETQQFIEAFLKQVFLSTEAHEARAPRGARTAIEAPGSLHLNN